GEAAPGEVTAPPLAYFPFFDYFTESHYGESTETNDKTSPEGRIARHRKTESHAATAQERRCQNTGISHRARGRAVNCRLSGQSLAAPRRDHDPDGLPPRAKGLRGLRPAMDPG